MGLIGLMGLIGMGELRGLGGLKLMELIERIPQVEPVHLASGYLLSDVRGEEIFTDMIMEPERDLTLVFNVQQSISAFSN